MARAASTGVTRQSGVTADMAREGDGARSGDEDNDDDDCVGAAVDGRNRSEVSFGEAAKVSKETYPASPASNG